MYLFLQCMRSGSWRYTVKMNWTYWGMISLWSKKIHRAQTTHRFLLLLLCKIHKSLISCWRDLKKWFLENSNFSEMEMEKHKCIIFTFSSETVCHLSKHLLKCHKPQGTVWTGCGTAKPVSHEWWISIRKNSNAVVPSLWKELFRLSWDTWWEDSYPLPS